MIIIYLIGLILYSTFEGITEAMTWYLEDVESHKYHFCRLMETVGISLMLVSVYLLQYQLVNLIRLAIGTPLLGFLIYRIGFILQSGQVEICPKWKYDIWIPMLGTLRIAYPPELLAYILAAGGLFLILI